MDEIERIERAWKCIDLKSPWADRSILERNCTDLRPTWFWNSTNNLDCDRDCPKQHWSYNYGLNSIPAVNGECFGPNECSSRISVTFQSSFKTVKTIRWEKTSLELLSEIGGHLGLFVGVSLMTLAEIGEFLLSLCFKACKRIRKIYPKKEVGLNHSPSRIESGEVAGFG